MALPLGRLVETMLALNGHQLDPTEVAALRARLALTEAQAYVGGLVSDEMNMGAVQARLALTDDDLAALGRLRGLTQDAAGIYVASDGSSIDCYDTAQTMHQYLLGEA